MTEPAQSRDRRSGQYSHRDMDALCVCGHALGMHTAETVGGERPCIIGDFDTETCDCMKFRKSKAKKKENPPMGHHEDLFKSQHGKFENKATEILYEISLDGGCDEECGDVEATGWFGLVRGPFNDEKGNEIPGLGSYAGAILQNDSAGFVFSEFFTSEAKMKKKWKQVEKEVSSLEEEGDE